VQIVRNVDNVEVLVMGDDRRRRRVGQLFHVDSDRLTVEESGDLTRSAIWVSTSCERQRGLSGRVLRQGSGAAARVGERGHGDGGEGSPLQDLQGRTDARPLRWMESPTAKRPEHAHTPLE